MISHSTPSIPSVAWSAAELEKPAKEIEVAGGQATLVEMSGTDARSGQASSLAGVMVMRGGRVLFSSLQYRF